MDCPNCGSKVPEKADFCSLCLNKIRTGEETAGEKQSAVPDTAGNNPPNSVKALSDEDIFRMLREDNVTRSSRKKKAGIETELSYALAAAVTLGFLFIPYLINAKRYFIAGFVFIELLTAQIAYSLAVTRGKNGIVWWFGGLFGSFFTVIAAFFMPAAPKTGFSRICPECAEIIKEESSKCRFCGSEIKG